MDDHHQRRRERVLGVPVDALDWSAALDAIGRWAARRESRVVCIVNAHSVVTATSDPLHRRALEDADLSTPDGMPVVWMLRLLGAGGQPRVDGPGLMWRCCGEAAARGERVYLYGSTPGTLARLRDALSRSFPGLQVAGVRSPPFRPLTHEEDAAVVRDIVDSGAGVVFVGLGCPRQERWMHEHRGRVPAVMIGVGAAFDFHAGTVRRAPRWMRDSGLEWLHRLASEPRRLWRRYLTTNSLFLLGACRQLVRDRHARKGAGDGRR